MLRKIQILMIMLIAVVASGKAQNLQLHFDARHAMYGDEVASVNYLTATYEMFKPDAWGSTFMFVDFDFNFNQGGQGLVYGEISRAIKMGNCPVMAHLEYNGGLGLVRNTGIGFSIPNAYLAGIEYPFQLGRFFMGTYVAYKYNAFAKGSHDAQWTLTWNSSFANNKLSFGGFLDLWSENKNPLSAGDGKHVVFLSEPQLWYNVTPNFSLGSEVELSYNFVNKGTEKFYAIPTVATKWTF